MLELKNITKKYNDKIILDDISIRFPSNSLIGIKGKSGSGKSTLLYILGMLDSDYEGQLLFNGENIDDNLKYIREHVSYIMQCNDYISSLNVEENIKLAQIISDKSITLDESLLKDLNIHHLLHKYPSELSGGELKRMCIAKAVFKQSSIVLCDEPTGALSYEQSVDVMEILKEISKDRLVIIVSHNEQLLENYCDLVLELKECKLLGNISFDNHKRDYICDYKKTNLWFYPIRQILNHKYKYIFLFIFQWIIAACFILMLSFMCGAKDMLEDYYNHHPKLELIYCENKDNSIFESLDCFKNYKYYDYNYNLDYLQMKDYKADQFSFLPHNTSHIQLKEGRFPKQNEVLISETLDKVLNNKKELQVIYNDKILTYKVSGVIKGKINNKNEIYFSLLEKKSFEELIDSYSVVIEVESDYIEETMKSLKTSYEVSNEPLLEKDSYKTLIQSAEIVAYVFMSMNILISLLLIKIVFNIVFYERRQECAYLYSLGMDVKIMKRLFINEVVIIGGLIIIGAVGLSLYTMTFINETGKIYEMFSIILKLEKIFLSPYDIFIILGFLYIFVALSASLKPIHRVIHGDFIQTLRGE